MENFIVSARKYRPVTFDTVVGQKSITSTLKNAIKNKHLAQAFLFCGPRGVGKTTCARILAKTINCEQVTENTEACDSCESCKSFNNSASFNVHELDAASNNSVDDIRNLVDQVRIPPQAGKYKVYIIDEVHMLSSQAFNAFLKTLEEPPAYAKFILATTEKHKIIPTILSRCQIFDFKRIGIEDIAQHLAFVAQNENISAEPDALHIIAQKADGALRDALSVFDQIVSFSGTTISYKNVIENLNVLDYDYYFKIVEALLHQDISTALLIINEIIDNGFDGQHFITGLGEHLRNLLVCKDAATHPLLELGENIKKQYITQSQQCEVLFLLQVLDINNTCDIRYKSSNNKRLHLELSLMQMCSINSLAGKIREEKIIKPPVKKHTENESANVASANIAAPATQEKPETITKHTKTDKEYTKLPVSISIKNYSQTKNQENISEVKEPETVSNLPTSAFTQQTLELAWSEYMQLINEKNPSFAGALGKYKPQIKEDFVIEFKTDNNIIAGDRKNISELQGFLKKKLNNYQLVLEAVVSERQESNKAYTDQERFEKMAQHNPALKDLKEKLDLEIEF